MSDDRTNILGLDDGAPEALGEAIGHALNRLVNHIDDGGAEARVVAEVANWLLELFTRVAYEQALVDRGPRLRDVFTDAELDTFDEVRQMITDNDAEVGTTTTKTEVRQTGCSIHYKFQRKTTVMGGAATFVAITDQSPAKLFWLVDKILEAADRPLPEEG